MRRRRNRYSSYRGRRTLTDVLKMVAFALGIAALLLLAILWMVGRETDREKGQEAQSHVAQSDISQPDPPQTGSMEEDSSLAENDAEKQGSQTEQIMRAVELPLAAVLDGTAQALLEQEAANALVLTMKNREGELAWDTQQGLAVSLGLGAGEEEVNRLLEQWNQGEVYTVAWVCCFRDNTLPYHRNSMALRADYGNWRDELGLRWLNPASQEAQSYLVQLCGELAALGFDEIVLECPAFPVEGSVDRILLDGADQGQVVSGFLEQVGTAVAPYGTQLSVYLEPEQLTGESGLTPDALGGVERLWVQASASRSELAGFLSRLETAVEERLVEVVEELSQEDVPQAKLDSLFQ